MLTVVAEAFTDVGDATLVESEHELPENQLDPIYDEHVVTPTEHERIVETLTKLLFTIADIPVERPPTRSFEQDHDFE